MALHNKKGWTNQKGLAGRVWPGSQTCWVFIFPIPLLDSVWNGLVFLVGDLDRGISGIYSGARWLRNEDCRTDNLISDQEQTEVEVRPQWGSWKQLRSARHSPGIFPSLKREQNANCKLGSISTGCPVTRRGWRKYRGTAWIRELCSHNQGQFIFFFF